MIGSITITSLNDNEKNDICEIDVSGFINNRYLESDYYKIFLEVRREIEENHNALIACYGSLKQFFISGLALDWSNGLKGYILNETTLTHEAVSPYKEVDAEDYFNLVKINEQILYREKFLRENRERFIERNKALEAKVQKYNGEGVQSIKGFLKKD